MTRRPQPSPRVARGACHVDCRCQRGEIVEMPPPTKPHGVVCGNISARLWIYSQQRGRGYVCTNDTGVIVEEDPDTVRGPDLSYYDDVQSFDDVERGYASVPPLLTVDVLSPHDRPGRMAVRVAQLLARGVQLVWVVDPEGREVCVYRRGRDPYVVTENEELTGEDVLPGFRCRVSEFFALPGQTGSTPASPNQQSANSS
jgi:Uma2 family endonuclease